MYRRLMLIVVLLAGLTLPGCITRYVIVNEVAKSELRLTIVSNDTYRGGQVLGRLSGLGYDNDENEVVDRLTDGRAIRWGAAPGVYVEEIATLLERKFDARLARRHDLAPDDFDVLVELPFDDFAPPSRAEFEVTIFTDDTDRGEAILARLLALGYTNEGNSVAEDPNDDFNVKWGSAPGDYIDEIVDAVRQEDERIETDRQKIFSYDDNDIFLNLPFWQLAPATRERFEITVFCDDEETGAAVLEMLAGLGYTNEDNEVLGEPNDEFNIKYGALPAEFLGEIAGALDERFGVEFERLDQFDEDDRDVFINIPNP